MMFLKCKIKKKTEATYFFIITNLAKEEKSFYICIIL